MTKATHLIVLKSYLFLVVKFHPKSNHYRLKDLNNEEIQGSFYEPELLKAKQDVFRIDKDIHYQKKQALVKWLGYGDDFNPWIPMSSLHDLSN